MTPERNDEKLELYLRQFRPKPPRSLPQPHRIVRRIRGPVFAAVAALMLIAVLLLLQQQRGPHQPQIVNSQPPNLAQEASVEAFNRLLRQDPEKVEAAMDSLSPRLLPDVQRSRGILKTLARE
jgi:hypothetical protein